MPNGGMQCMSCFKMDCGVQEGIPRDFLDYDFVAEDALDFEVSLQLCYHHL